MNPNKPINDLFNTSKSKTHSSSSETKELSISSLLSEIESLKIQLNNEKKEHKKEIEKLKKQLNNEIRNQDTNENKSTFEILDVDSIQNLEKLEEISSGSSGRVYKVAKRTIYALKEMKVGISHEVFRQFVKEYELLSHFQHPNIVKAYGIFLSDKTRPASILLEYCSMNLEEAIKKKIHSNVEIVIMIFEIIEGMKYVHSQKVIHRDIKPSNILIGKDGKIKISDFGISKIMNAEKQSMTCGVGTQKYMAPEIIDENETYDEKVDVYSFGVVLYFMLTGGEVPKIKMSDKMKGKKPEIPTTFTQLARNIISSCWNFESQDRPSFFEMMNEIEQENYEIIKLTKSEIKEVKNQIKERKSKIPKY